MFIFSYETQIGKIKIAENDQKITGIFFDHSQVLEQYQEQETENIKTAADQLYAYLAGELREFSFPIEMKGTDFMIKVWQKLIEVPYGKTATYKDIAISIGNPKAVRAVGMANNRNPLPIVVPCHRIIGSNGSLVGYGGGLDIKLKLLALEAKNFH